MIIKAGQKFNGMQEKGRKDSSKASNSDVFGGILSKTQKKKKAVQPKKTQPKKKTDSSIGNDDQQHAKLEQRPKKQLVSDKPQARKITVNPQKQEKQQSKIAETQIKHEVAVKEDHFSKKFLQTEESGVENQLSLNSSEPLQKTLDKKIEISEKIQEVLNQQENIKDPVQANKVLEMTSKNAFKPMQAKTVLPKINNDSGIKLDPKMNLNTEVEFMNQASVKPMMQSNLDEQGTNDGQQDTSSLEALLQQGVEIETGIDTNNTTNFADEMTQALDGGKADKVENMGSIVKQARAFVDDGGGSMEIHLQPEGLGKVHLKVAVNDGQVNVEMLADNAAAKKALEEGLVDIKNALEGQKLLVETLKVEMSQDYQKDFSDLQNHMQEQANRDFAEQFLGQFRQEREERFGGLFDSFKNYQRSTNEPELTLNRRNPYAEQGKGRSINLVA